MSAQADPAVSLNEENNTLQIKIDADKDNLSVFEDDNSLWVVSDNRSGTLLDMPSDLRKKYNIEMAESLKVNGGSGVRLQFKDATSYQVNIIDEPLRSAPLSVISLKNGLVLSGLDDKKVLVASSPSLDKHYTVIPFGSNSAQKSQKHADKSETLASYIGYVFETEKGDALKSLYKNRQYFLAGNTDDLIDMSKRAQLDGDILSTRREAIKPQVTEAMNELSNPTALTALTTPVIEKISPKTDKNSENLTVTQFSTFKVPTVPVVLDESAYSAPQQVLSTKTKAFIKDDEAFDRAMDKIRQARQKLTSLKIPVDMQNEFATSLNDGDDFESFFGTAADDSDLVNMITIQDTSGASITKVNEVPVVSSEEDAIKLAQQVLEGEGVFENGTLDGKLPKKNGFVVDDDIDVFEIPDLDPNEPIFEVYGDGTEEDYQKFQHRILNAIATAPNEIKRQQFRLRLAKLYMSYLRPQEVLMTMDNMPEYEGNDMLRDTSARILSGAANLVMNRPDDAMLYLKTQSDNFEEDRNLWLAVAHEMKDEDAESIDLFKKYISKADEYPPYLQKEVYISYGRVLLRQEHLSELKKVMQELASKLKKPQLPPEALMLLARASIIERNDDLAETLLSQVAAGDNMEASFLAQYEFVSFLLQRGDLGSRQAIQHLENLRYLWRGGQVEEEILMKLGHMYVAKGDQRKGLERLKYHNVYFPNSKNIPHITDVMTTAFTDLYLDETAGSELDPLALLGLYYDFRELTPSGIRGDALIAQISERLRKLGLYDEAIKMLEHQLKYRVKEEDVKGDMGKNLALLYLLNKQYDESLGALNRTESPALSKDINLERTYIESEALIGLKKYEPALEALSGIDSSRATMLRAKVGWVQEKYASVIKNLQSIFDDTSKVPYEWSDEMKVEFVQLALAYNNLGKLRELEDLEKRYKKQVNDDPKIREVIDFLMRDQGSDRVVILENKEGLWPKLTNALDIYHNFTGFYDDFVYQRETDRRDKDIYNRRMRQMSAPARY